MDCTGILNIKWSLAEGELRYCRHCELYCLCIVKVIHENESPLSNSFKIFINLLIFNFFVCRNIQVKEGGLVNRKEGVHYFLYHPCLFLPLPQQFFMRWIGIC